MKKLIKKLLPVQVIKILRDFKNNYLDGFSLKSYSDEGEDMILNKLFENKEIGFYVDVGAHHPKRFSNTYFFYKKGWRGINIDAMPGSMSFFRRFRPRDISLETPISNDGKALTYYVFNEPALNGFSKELSKERIFKNNNYFIRQEISLQTYKLAEILSKNLPKHTEIDFLSIDVEGLDYEVIKSNDWNNYKPKVVVVEILGKNLSEIEHNEIAIFLGGCGYIIFAKAFHSVVFVQDGFIDKR
jgi:FkbM family methyltransferase